MNIKFTVMAHGFDKAAMIEKALKDLGVPYDAQVTTEPCNPKAKKVSRKRLNKAAVVAIIQTADTHPQWTNEAIAKASGCSDTTVDRVLAGVHVLQKRGEAPIPTKARLQ